MAHPHFSMNARFSFNAAPTEYAKFIPLLFPDHDPRAPLSTQTVLIHLIQHLRSLAAYATRQGLIGPYLFFQTAITPDHASALSLYQGNAKVSYFFNSQFHSSFTNPVRLLDHRLSSDSEQFRMHPFPTVSFSTVPTQYMQNRFFSSISRKKKKKLATWPSL